jgi:hypothetical protein
MSNFVYEYIFTGSFDDNIFSQGPISDADFQASVQSTADLITQVLTFNSGIPSLSSTVQYTATGDNYKVTVTQPPSQ